ncbi:MAG: transporter substrate-binding domain-containing protein [Alphaproteobacteria bacterium]
MVKEDAFERVMRTGVLRCGFVDYNPTNIVDPKTGAQSGILYDVAEEMAVMLGLKVEWIASEGWAAFVTDLAHGRFDAFCGAGFGLPQELKETELIGPIYYSPIFAWVRHDDARFDQGLQVLNSAEFTIAETDGSVSGIIAREDFPLAKIVSLPQTAPYTSMLLNVESKKADVAFVENFSAYGYIAHNTQVLKRVETPEPVRIYTNVFSVKKGEFALQSMLQRTLENMHMTGKVKAILAKYAEKPDTFWPVAEPYKR